jgi:general secretion pathway protein D
VATICVVHAGCSQLTDVIDANRVTDPSERVRGEPSEIVQHTDFLPRFAQRARQTSQSGPSLGPATYPAQGAATFSHPAQEAGLGAAVPVPGSDAFQLNFENASIPSVARVLLGDILKLTYTIDQRVQGTINISSSEPIARQDILPIFESALRANGALLVKDRASYRIVPTADASTAIGVAQSGEVGYAVSVIPLRNVSAQVMVKLIEGLASKPGTIRADTARNAIIVQGTSAERASVAETVASFDVAWLRNQSVGIFPLKNAAPNTIITELQRIVEAKEGGPAADHQESEFPRSGKSMDSASRSHQRRRDKHPHLSCALWRRPTDRRSSQ